MKMRNKLVENIFVPVLQIYKKLVNLESHLRMFLDFGTLLEVDSVYGVP
jgi:hypothetical protein